MNQYDLTFATASGTYQRLLQTADGFVYDGLGNTFSNNTLGDLSDVSISGTPSNGQLLSFNSSTNKWELSDSPIKLIFDFNFGEFSYIYSTPYDLKINSFETSITMSVNLFVNGITYSTGNLISKFDNLKIETNTQGIVILEGNKL
jgi:hypothetical protein